MKQDPFDNPVRGAPRAHIFRLDNWFRWVIDTHNLGYSQADILFVLDIVGVRQEMIRALQADAAKREEEQA